MLSAIKHYRTAWCVAVGWALLAAWADLFGHSAGFAQSYSGLVGLGNMRIYWLVGLLLLSAAMAAFPRAFERSKRILFFCMPLAASFGTMAFAVAAQQAFFQPEAIALLGIVVAGAGYAWFTFLFCGILAETQSMSCAIGGIVASLALKTALVQVFTGALSEAAQVGLAIVLPFAIAALAEAGERGPRTRTDLDEWVPAPDAPASYRYVAPQILAAALAVATTRVLTPLGFFGDPLNQFMGAMPIVVGTISMIAVLVGLSYVVLAKRTKIHLNRRFMPAFLVVLIAFFVSALTPSSQGIVSAAAEVFITAVEALAHALFWTLVVTAIRLGGASRFRVVGLSTGFYDAVSIIWVAWFFSLGVMSNAAVLLVAFVLVMLVIWLIDRGGGEERPATPPELIVDRRGEIAERAGLSPRETEVFMMLAQGRSRAFISEELVLSEGTVKTHISHIYTKLNVHGRQEMFDLLLAEDSEAAERDG